MRIMIKGGVWKNTEDEILKAAVMKYGKNQWARISSLLVRKSAKQCKARWYEWLDPSIRKTQWTRQEDEKLLHLAKIMPTQWRTIAPIVGRTPSQCLERYEKLLDVACAKDESYEPNDDPRKLRPGEFDPNPESKPARPDPVDMDEDEKEMLSEARARLANTKGKKANRKAREKQLEEARRLATLQKKRELKAAGTAVDKRKKKLRGIDYNLEIPFEKRPPPGFYDVADEEKTVTALLQTKFSTTIEELEGKRRVDVEAQMRKQDIARRRIAQRKDAPSSILQANKLNHDRRRSTLMLPPPQITDDELEEMAKMVYGSDLVSGTQGSVATQALLEDYTQISQTPFRTPQRTPGGKANAIMMEAENLSRLRETQTPLLGGDNPELHLSDFSGVIPKKAEMQTPNPLSTPRAMGLMTPSGTPVRDGLHINEDMHKGSKLESMRNLRSNLKNFPQPQNEYQITIQQLPEDKDDEEEPGDHIEEDKSCQVAREKAEEEARQQALLKKRSKVLQRELPRPPTASVELIRNSLKSSGEQADEMIQKELLLLLEHDNARYPLDKEKTKKQKYTRLVPEIEEFDENTLREAGSDITEEIQLLRIAMEHENETLDDFVKAHDECQGDIMFFPTRTEYGLSSVATNAERLVALQNQFDGVKTRMGEKTKKAQCLEQKLKLLTHGYQKLAGELLSQTEVAYKKIHTAAISLECFQALQKQEHLAASNRIKGLLDEIRKQKVLEEVLQKRYGNMMAEQERIQKAHGTMPGKSLVYQILP